MILLAAAAAGARAQSNSPETPPDLEPYRVCISVAFQENPAFTPPVRRRLLDEIADSSARSVGTMWTLTVEENRWLVPADRGALERLTAERVLERYKAANADEPAGAELPFDKICLLTVEPAGARFRVSGREWDEAARALGPVETSESFQRPALAEACFSLARRLFRPVLTVEDGDGVTFDLLLRAGALPPVDPAAVQLRKGDVIAPFFRYLDKDRAVQNIQSMPWTYFVVDSVDRGYVSASLLSAFRLPLGSGRRRRVELMGTVVRPLSRSSRLRMVQQVDPTKPLAGHRVEIVAKKFPNDKSEKEPLPFYTDRQGEIRVPVDADYGVVWVYVYSGEALVARVPYAPGVRPLDVLELPDDSLRLQVEGEVALLKGRLIDTVARRATLSVLAKSFAEKGQWDEVDKRLRELDGLPGQKDFDTWLHGIRQPALTTARSLKNRVAERKIQKLCGEFDELMKKHLDPKKIEAVKTELAELRGSS